MLVRLLPALLLVVIAGCQGATENAAAPKPPIDWSLPTTVTVTADQLGKEWSASEHATLEKYGNAMILLTGTVRSMNRDLFGYPLITLKVKDQIVQLQARTTDPAPWKKALPGQQVKLKAKFTDLFNILGHAGGPGNTGTRLYLSPILETTGEAIPEITAQALVKEFETDPGAAEKKYRQSSPVIVVGEVELAEPGSPQTAVPKLTLKTGSKLALHCRADRDSVRSLKAGQQARLIGLCYGFDREDAAAIQVVECVAIGKK